MNETFFVALDGGGTGTRVRAYLPNRELLGEGVAGASSLSLGVENSWKNIFLAINESVENTDFSGRLPSKLVAGLAGSRNLQQQQAFFSHVADEVGSNAMSIDIVSDAYTSALGALSGQSGIVVAIGTGLGACAIDVNFRPRYVSGWGFQVGDEGAGSWIGLQAVQAYLKHFDGRETHNSKVYEVVASVLGESVMAIQQWCLTATATNFAYFAKPIVQLANESDALALDIMQRAAGEVTQVIEAYADIDTQSPIVLLGGLGQAMSAYLSETIRVRLQAPKGTSLDGASAILFGDCPTEINELND